MKETCHTYEMICHTYEGDMSHVRIRHVSTGIPTWSTSLSHVIHLKETCHVYEWNMSAPAALHRIPMGWLWLVGSIKLQVSFAKETYKRDDILQKRPIILSILLTVATPYVIYIARVKETCHKYECGMSALATLRRVPLGVMSYAWRKHVTYVHMYTYIYECIYICIYVTHWKEKSHTHQKKMSQIWTRYVTHMKWISPYW